MAKPSRQHKQGALVGVAVAAAIIGGSLLARDQLQSGAAKPKIAPAAQILVLINTRRAAAGLHLLKRDLILAALARRHNRDQRRLGVFAHDEPEPFTTRVAPLHRHLSGEVIAWGTAGFATPAGFVSLWFASPGHKRVLLTPDMRRIGISVICGSYLGQHGACLATADLSS